MALSTVNVTTTTCAGDACGGRCNGEQVEVLTSARAKTVRFAACTYLLRQGWTGHQVALYKTDTSGLTRWGLS